MHNGRRSDVQRKPRQTRAQVIHKHPTEQQQNQAPTPRVNTQIRITWRHPMVESSETHMQTPEKRKSGRSPRMTANQVPIINQENVNHMK